MTKRIAVIGGNGQVGRALRGYLQQATFFERDRVDFTNPSTLATVDWGKFDTVVNAVAYTAVDKAEQEPELARQINATTVGMLAELLSRTNTRLIHFSSDYVFDGEQEVHPESEMPNPLSVYGHTKNQGDVMASANPNTYIVRTSWVVGDGNNFARTMLRLANEGIDPSAVDDQFGRLTLADQLAAFTKFLADERPNPGIYNISGSGPVTTWLNIAREVFRLGGHDLTRVTNTTTTEYFAGKAHATRPKHSTLDLRKTEETGFRIEDWHHGLEKYIAREIK